MCPASDDVPTDGAPLHSGVTLRRLGRATAIAAAALAGSSGAPAANAAAPVAPTRSSGAHPERTQTYAETSLAPAGAVFKVGVASAAVPHVRVFDVAPDGHRSPAITVSDKSRAAQLGGTQVRAGATAVAFLQHLGGDRWEPRVAYRPKGASAFLPAIAAGPVGSKSERPEGFVALGADGAGVVYGFGLGPGYTVKRLHADGSLGPAIVVAPRAIGRGSMRVAFGRDGTLVVAIRTRADDTLGTAGDDETYREDVYATTLPAGANHATPLERLSTGDRDPTTSLASIAHSVGAAIQAPDAAYLSRFQP